MEKEIAPEDTILVHPCFWMALNLKDDVLRPNNLEEIHDEYAITVTDEPLEVRNQRLGQLSSEYGNIPQTTEGDQKFAEWCCRALGTIFAGFLHDIKLDDRGSNEISLRLAAGLNLSKTETWQILSNCYGVRNVAFGFSNQTHMHKDWLRHFVDRLVNNNGQFGFVVTRGDKVEIEKEGELDLIREVFKQRGITIVRLTGSFLVNLLGKLRNPQKHDAIDHAMFGLIRSFSHLYIREKKFVLTESPASTAVAPEENAVAVIDAPANECYAEVDLNPDGDSPCVRIFQNRPGPGRKSELCEPILIKDQALQILQSGIESARQQYVEEMRERASADGRPVDPSECEPPVEQCFEVNWSQNDLSKLLHNKSYSDLGKNQKGAIKTAISRLRNLIQFAQGKTPFITEPDDRYCRAATVKLRMKK